MANNGSEIRKLDQLGRIVIPKSVKAELGLNEGDSLKITCENGKIVMEPHDKACIFCGGNKNLIEFKGKTVCKDCLEEALDW